jgi:hypothetical protein
MTEYETQALAVREKTARSKALRFLRFAIRYAQEQPGKGVGSNNQDAAGKFIRRSQTNIPDRMRIQRAVEAVSA